VDAKDVMAKILDTALKVSAKQDQIKDVFEKSGISVKSDMTVGGVDGDATDALRNLMSNLSSMAVVKISAKQVIRKAGINL